MSIYNYSSIYTLGPQGTFSDEVAQKICSSSTKIVYSRTFAETLTKLSESENCAAVVPIENSVAGIVAQVQEILVTENLTIVAEFNLPIQYAFLSNASSDKVAICFAHPQASEQTSHFILKNLPQASIEPSHSNIDSGIKFLKAVEEKKVAAIVPLAFAEKHNQFLHSKNVQDYKSNTTRFLVIEKRNKIEQFDFTQQKTSLFIQFKEDRAGLLYELLKIFNQFNINLCRLESRPSKEIPWFYVFYVDFNNTDQSSECISAIQNSSFECKILGSFSLIQ